MVASPPPPSSSQQRPQLRVCVEGNIGCGKSAALQRLAELRPDLRVFQEPVEEWDALLRLYYADQSKWGLAMQLRVLLSYGSRTAAAAPHPAGAPATEVVVTERSPSACRHVFGQLLFNEHKLAEEEWDLFKEYCEVLGWTPDVIVYVHTPADECLRRVEQRGRQAEQQRAEEGGIDLTYLKRVEFQYDTMLRYIDVPVVRLDGTASPDALAAAISEVADQARLKAA